MCTPSTAYFIFRAYLCTSGASLALAAQVWFTYAMRDAIEVACEALALAATDWNDTGLAAEFAGLTRAVWRNNLDRHETELGDDATTLGTQCSRNLANLVKRSIDGDADTEPAWRIPELSVASPRGAQQISLNGRHYYTMKAPPTPDRSPKWDSLVAWSNESATRLEVARRNSSDLDDYYGRGLGQPPIWPHMTGCAPSALRHFLIVWAGEPEEALTAGWITLPGLGDAPFIAIHRLWWDEASGKTADIVARKSPDGPGFDDRPSVLPSISLKPRPGSTDEA